MTQTCQHLKGMGREEGSMGNQCNYTTGKGGIIREIERRKEGLQLGGKRIIIEQGSEREER